MTCSINWISETIIIVKSIWLKCRKKDKSIFNCPYLVVNIRLYANSRRGYLCDLSEKRYCFF
jgi:hypothetical protein